VLGNHRDSLRTGIERHGVGHRFLDPISIATVSLGIELWSVTNRASAATTVTNPCSEIANARCRQSDAA
jgi:hypothetical protein